MKTRLTLLIFLNIITIACGSPYSATSTVDLEVALQQEIDSLQAEYGFPGATVAIATPGGEVLSVATGFSDLETGKQMHPESRMLAASIGKTFVAATVLSLTQDEILNLDDTVSDWLSHEPWINRLEYADSITLKHLLQHSAGVSNHVDDENFIEDFAKHWSDASFGQNPTILIHYILDDSPLFDPGEAWSYSDTGYILLGLVVEAATGNTYYEEVTNRVIQPLGLNSTSPSNQRDLNDLAAGYMSRANQFGLPTKTVLENGQMAWNPGIEWTGGGLISNSTDLALWGKILFEGRAMRGAYMDQLLEGIPVSPDDPNTTFGLGVAIRRIGPMGEWYSHGGWIPGYTSSLRYYPRYKIAIAFQINTDIGIVDDSTDLYDKMASRLEDLAIHFVSR